MGKFQKGNSGKPKGALGKTTKEARELYLKVIEGEGDYIKEALSKLREEDTFKYLQVVSKFTQYVLPKLKEVTVIEDNKQIFEPVTINIKPIEDDELQTNKPSNNRIS